jgi:hypothetical protein
MRDLTKALISLYPNANWELNGDEYDGLVWKSDDIPKPTEEELIAECDRLDAEYEDKQYQRNRAKKYAWKAEIDKVKEKYPKP